MASIHNPSKFDLMCAALGESIGPGDTIEVSDEVAARVTGSVFVVAHGEPEAQPQEMIPAAGGAEPEKLAADAAELAAAAAKVAADEAGTPA